MEQHQFCKSKDSTERLCIVQREAMYTFLNRSSHLKCSLPITQRRKADAKMHHKLEVSHRTVLLQTPHYLEETRNASLFFHLIAR